MNAASRRGSSGSAFPVERRRRRRARTAPRPARCRAAETGRRRRARCRRAARTPRCSSGVAPGGGVSALRNAASRSRYSARLRWTSDGSFAVVSGGGIVRPHNTASATAAAPVELRRPARRAAAGEQPRRAPRDATTWRGRRKMLLVPTDAPIDAVDDVLRFADAVSFARIAHHHRFGADVCSPM